MGNRLILELGQLLLGSHQHVIIADLLLALLAQGIAALRKAWNPEGFNIGANIGKVAGAGVKDHVHMHVVPRWGGDANFITVIGGTKVIPQLLRDTRKLLADEWAAQDGKAQQP